MARKHPHRSSLGRRGQGEKAEVSQASTGRSICAAHCWASNWTSGYGHAHSSERSPRSMSIDGDGILAQLSAQASARSREEQGPCTVAWPTRTGLSASQSGLGVARTPEQNRTLKSLVKATRTHAPPMIEATAEGPGPVANGGRLASRAAYFKIRRTPPPQPNLRRSSPAASGGDDDDD